MLHTCVSSAIYLKKQMTAVTLCGTGIVHVFYLQRLHFLNNEKFWQNVKKTETYGPFDNFIYLQQTTVC